AESPPNVHDLPALVPDWATAQPHTLPERLHAAIPAGSHGVQFWAALGDDPQGARLGQALYAASRTAVLGHRPVELMTRDQQGIRRWEFTPEGALITADPDLTTAWNAFDTQAEILHNATHTLTDTPQLLNRLTAALQQANRAHATAVETHRKARLAVTGAIDVHRRATETAAASAEAARKAEALVKRMKRDLAEARSTVTTLPSVIQQHARDEATGRHDLQTALARLTQTENAVRTERIAAARAAAEQAAKNGQSSAAPAPAPVPVPPTPAVPGAPRSHEPAADVADDPRVRAVLPAIADANDAIRQAATQLAAERPELDKAKRIVEVGPTRIRQEEGKHEEAVEKARQDAADVVLQDRNLREARKQETVAQGRVTEAENEVTRRNGRVVAAVTAQIQAAAEQVSATAALPGLSSDVQDSAPAPEQSLRTTFATTPPRWPTPDGRPAPLPAGGQTHTPGPATTAASTSTPTPKPTKQQPKKSGPSKSGTSG
ncbi:hypothetical protein, partial [Streptomyces sp. STR69]|uniref:hypothetical protein n=1 Tax=Streptomyces sp. STR69 TaxID=1796942 RepID=UPI0021C75AF4